MTTTYRDRDVRNAIVTALEATGQFDGVWISGLPEDSGTAAGDHRAVAIEPAATRIHAPWDDIATGTVNATSTVTLTVLVRHEDPQVRDEEAERLAGVIANALDGQSLAALTLPEFTYVTGWTWHRATAPERRLAVAFSYQYFDPTAESLDVTD